MIAKTESFEIRTRGRGSYEVTDEVARMVKASGLKEGMVAVAPIKLMLHLTTAAVIFTLLVMVATRFTPKADEGAPRTIKRAGVILLLLTLLQIALGALVAGSKAGMTWNTWPLIDGHFIPPAEMLFSVVPWIENFVDNAALVQFNHRMSAYVLLIFAVWHWWQVKRVMPGTGASLTLTKMWSPPPALVSAQPW